MTIAKSVLLKVKYQNEICDLLVKTNSQNVVVDASTGETLKTRLITLANKIAELEVNTGNDVTEKLNTLKADLEGEITTAINDLVDGTGDSTKLDTIKDLVDWIGTHTSEYDALKDITTNMKTELQGKIDALEETVASNKTELETSLANTKSELESTINTTKEELAQSISELDSKIDTRVPDEAEEGASLVRRNNNNVWEKLLNVVETVPTEINEGQFYCVVLPDAISVTKADGSKVAYDNVEDAVENAESGETVLISDYTMLSKDVTVPSGVTVTVADGVTLDLNGYEFKEA